MSPGYWFYSFDQRRFERYFGGDAPEARQAVIDGALWEAEGYFDGSDGMRPGPNRDAILATPRGRRVAALADRMTRQGLSYDGLDEADARELDRMVASWPAPECLADHLDFKPHSPDFAGRRLMDWIARPAGAGTAWWARLARPKPTAPPRPSLISQLIDGRRFGAEPSDPRPADHYFIAAPREVADLNGEIGAALTAARLPTEDARLVKTYLLDPLAAIAATGRPLFATYS